MFFNITSIERSLWSFCQYTVLQRLIFSDHEAGEFTLGTLLVPYFRITGIPQILTLNHSFWLSRFTVHPFQTLCLEPFIFLALFLLKSNCKYKALIYSASWGHWYAVKRYFVFTQNNEVLTVEI